MKVGILTYQFADNYGAVLQCFALRKVIQSISECDAQIINFVPPGFSYQITWKSDYEKVLYNRKRKMFQDFLCKYCGIDSPVIYDLKNADNFDCYCVGSDQIWNTKKNYLAYFLPEIPSKYRKISYAASLGWMPDDARLDRAVLEKYLPQFDYISVREEVHVPIVESITGRSCSCVLDPSLLLNASDYNEIVCKEKLRDEAFIFFFWIRNDLTLMRGVEFVNALSRKYDLPIVHSVNSAPQNLFNLDAGDMQFESIENFLWYIQNAEIVVTNSYHATNFSIIFQKPFYTFVVNSMRARIDTLVHKLGIGRRVVEGYLAANDVEMNINYQSVMDYLKLEQKKSMDYIQRALGLEEN